MANPFPGIDPYLEAQDYWNDFRLTFLVELSRSLLWRLNNYYDTRIDGKEWTDTSEVGPGPDGRPTRYFEEIVERWVEVRRYDNSIVTAIELLKPDHKGRRRDDYLARRDLWLGRGVHLVELDFLVGGYPPSGRGVASPGFSATVTRGGDLKGCEVTNWSLRDPLPTIPLPLDPPDSDFALDLASIYDKTLDRAWYSRRLSRYRSLSLPLAPDDLAWAEATARRGN